MITKITSIRTTIIASDDFEHTYEVKKELLDENGAFLEGQDAILIGLYPTTAANEPFKTDMSTTHLLSKMQDLGLRSVRIVNLFSQVCTGRLSTRNLQMDEENLDYLEAMMQEESFADTLLILAWGSSMRTSKAAKQSKQRIVELFYTYQPHGTFYQLTVPSLEIEHEETVHMLYLGIRHKNETWSLAEYRFPEQPLPVKPKRKSKRQETISKPEAPQEEERS